MRRPPDWQDRKHFFVVAAKAIRQLLMDHARRKHARKRDPGAPAEWADQVRNSLYDIDGIFTNAWPPLGSMPVCSGKECRKLPRAGTVVP